MRGTKAEALQSHLETSLGKLPSINCNVRGISLWKIHEARNCLSYLHGSKYPDTHAWYGLIATCVLQ
eukprot:12893788-Prorocentrum_lima.AAC.1